MLRIKNIKLVISKTRIVIITVYSTAKTVTITIYFVIIKNAIVGNDFLINRISLFKVVIFVRSSIATFSIRELITFTKETFSVREISFIETSRIAIINEYRPSHMNVKDVIVFISLKIKEVYNARH